MIDNERELTGAVERLEIDTQPGAAHRAELRRQMLAAFEQAPTADDRPAGPAWADRLRRRIMNGTFARAAAAVVVAAAVIGVVAFWPGPDGSGGIALAEVRERFEKVRTACFKLSWYRNGKCEYAGPAKWREPGLLRWEVPGMIGIFDWAKGEFMSVLPEAKTAHSATIADIENPYYRNWISDLKKIVGSDSAEEAGEKEISGRKAKGWRFKDAEWLCTIWADAKTGDLLEAEWQTGNTRMVMSGFVLDKELDEGLFDLKPPAGYFHTRAKFGQADPSEKDVILLLRIWAMGGGDVFPDALDAREFPAAADKVDWKQLGIEMGIKSREESNKVSGAIPRAFWWLSSGHTWTYAGKGVRLGDEDKPVLWYRPKESKTYRVIYGDLSVKDIRPEDLPKAPPKRAETRPAAESD